MDISWSPGLGCPRRRHKLTDDTAAVRTGQIDAARRSRCRNAAVSCLEPSGGPLAARNARIIRWSNIVRVHVYCVPSRLACLHTRKHTRTYNTASQLMHRRLRATKLQHAPAFGDSLSLSQCSQAAQDLLLAALLLADRCLPRRSEAPGPGRRGRWLKWHTTQSGVPLRRANPSRGSIHAARRSFTPERARTTRLGGASLIIRELR